MNPPSSPDPQDPRMAEEVFQRFTHRLVALARARLDQRLAAKVDAEDVVQSVYKSFFWRFQEGQFEFASWDSLWGLLVRITLRKCLSQQEHHFAQQRDPRREVHPPAEGSSTGGWAEGYAREPDPGEAAVLVETVQQLMADLDPQQQQMLTLRLQGYSTVEISLHTLRSERTVERLMERIRQRVQRLDAADAAEA